MTFQEWWDSEERDSDYFLPVIAEAAWDAAVAAERERCAAICDRKHAIRSRDGFPREASAARSLAKEIRGQTQL